MEASHMSVAQLGERMQERQLKLPAEIGAFMVLEVCEALMDTAIVVDRESVFLSREGHVSLAERETSVPEDVAAKALVDMLGKVLLSAHAAVSTPLVRLIEDGPSNGDWNLESVHDDLEASLVPLNRSAARRVLSRMLRDVHRPMRPVDAELGGPGENTLDGEVDALLGGDSDASYNGEDTLQDFFDVADADGVPDSTPPSGDIENEPSGHENAVAEAEEDDLSSRGEPPEDTLSALVRVIDGNERRRGRWWTMGALLMVAVSSVFLIRPDLLSSFGVQIEAEEIPAVAVAERVSLRITPDDTQVFVRLGEAPVTAEGLFSGVAHEFLALSEGYQPTRTVLARDAGWAGLVNGRVTLSMRLEPGAEGISLGDTQLPRDVGIPGALASVEVQTQPSGAEVYLLVGIAPDVEVLRSADHAEMTFLLYHPAHGRRSITVRPEAWREANADGRLVRDVHLDAP